jgi:hypothetical protein
MAEGHAGARPDKRSEEPVVGPESITAMVGCPWRWQPESSVAVGGCHRCGGHGGGEWWQ